MTDNVNCAGWKKMRRHIQKQLRSRRKVSALSAGPARTLIAAALAFTAAACSPEAPTENIALNRTATASSSYDYNLTAQLVTDGIMPDGEPAWLRVTTADGELPRREKEWTLDGGPYSKNTLSGANNFIEYEWSRQSFSAGCVRIVGTVAFREPASGWSVKCLAGGTDGDLKSVGSVQGGGMPGERRMSMKVTDPNKETEEILCPACMLYLEIPVEKNVGFSHFKIEFNMPGAIWWEINSVDFTEGSSFGVSRDSGPYDSKESRGLNMLPSEMFTSAWMSADAEPQWICVDLGSERKFSEIRLNWIHGPQDGSVEVSDDGKSWKRKASLPNDAAAEYSLNVKGKARYVRVSMSGADESGHFALGEIAVIGPAQEKNLKDTAAGSGRWKVARASSGLGTGEEISSCGYDDSDWMPAVVPGTVLYSYIAAGAVPDPGIADNNLQISESYFNSDFWYRWTVDGQSSANAAAGTPAVSAEPGGRKILAFDGINWKAEVFFNGKRVGDIAGAFRRGHFDVTDLWSESGNAVAVHIFKNAHFGAVKEKNAESPDFNGGVLGADNPTFHATVGWDWMPSVRGRDSGIWNDVRIEDCSDVVLGDPLVTSRVAGPDTLASMTVSVKAANLSDVEVSGTLSGHVADIEFSRKVILAPGENEFAFSPDEFPQLKDRRIALWWPNGYGNPVLHEAAFNFIPEGGESAAASVSWQAGIREFTYSDVMSDLKMFINGHRFFPKGGNWGFSEYNLRFGADEYDTAVRMHRDMNLNMIRNWVGQTGDEEFYEACDRYGIVVWQDFWLANPADGPDPDDNAMFLDNARDYLSLIRRHPSIGLYCGRNEGYPPAELNSGLASAVSGLHPGIVYIPSSADDGVSGHGPYRAVEPDTYFTMPVSKFHTERGMPAIMEYESLRQMLTDGHLWPSDDVWGQHDFTRTGAQGDTAFVGMVRRRFGDVALESAESFAKYAQWINYDGYRAMYEANNVLRKGLLIWMSHSAWPSLAWQTYDYWFRPTAACAAVRKACEPVHVQLNPATGTVEVVNAGICPLDGLTATVDVLSPDGSGIWSASATVDAPEDSTVPAVEMNGVPDGLCIVRLKLTGKDGGVVSENRYFKNFRNGSDTGDYRGLVGTRWLESFE